MVADGDLDGDGLAVVVTANASPDTTTGHKVAVLVSRGDGTFAKPLYLVAGTSPLAVAMVDLNGDGKADIIATSRDSNRLNVLIN